MCTACVLGSGVYRCVRCSEWGVEGTDSGMANDISGMCELAKRCSERGHFAEALRLWTAALDALENGDAELLDIAALQVSVSART